VLRKLGRTEGILGDIYSGAQSRFNNPVNLKKLVSLIDEVQWTELGTDIKAAAYEGLLEKAAAEGKKGAGQYFTPRILIKAIVRCMKPDPRSASDFTICDPAVGTGGFLVAAHEWLASGPRGVVRGPSRGGRAAVRGGGQGLGRAIALLPEDADAHATLGGLHRRAAAWYRGRFTHVHRGRAQRALRE
jgi:hypothetical protein